MERLYGDRLFYCWLAFVVATIRAYPMVSNWWITVRASCQCSSSALI